MTVYHYSQGDNLPPFRQVVHCTAPGVGYPAASYGGQARGTYNYFQSPSSGGSAHWVFDIKESVRCADDSVICWHAPPNAHTLGYEICGEVGYTREQWLSPAVWPAVEACAKQVKDDASKYGIPIHRLTVAEVAADRAGQCGHVDVSAAFHQSDHTDPGPNFPWDRFMALLTDQPQGEDMPLSDAEWNKLEGIVHKEVAYALGYVEGQANSLYGGPQPVDLRALDALVKKIATKMGVEQ